MLRGGSKRRSDEAGTRQAFRPAPAASGRNGLPAESFRPRSLGAQRADRRGGGAGDGPAGRLAPADRERRDLSRQAAAPLLGNRPRLPGRRKNLRDRRAPALRPGGGGAGPGGLLSLPPRPGGAGALPR